MHRENPETKRCFVLLPLRPKPRMALGRPGTRALPRVGCTSCEHDMGCGFLPQAGQHLSRCPAQQGQPRHGSLNHPGPLLAR